MKEPQSLDGLELFYGSKVGFPGVKGLSGFKLPIKVILM